MSLTAEQVRFVFELCADSAGNGTQAYLRVFGAHGNMDKSVAAAAASRLRKNPEVKHLIGVVTEARLKKLELSAEDVLRDLFHVATTDTNEIIEWRIGACRYCHGFNHEYQRTRAEFARDLEAYMTEHAEDDPLGMRFRVRGGDGYMRTRRPVPECPECCGEGVGREYMHDTRDLGPGARTLYAGVQRTKGGFKALMRDKDRSIELAAKHLGIAKEKVEHSVAAGAGVMIYIPDNGRGTNNEPSTD